MPTTIDLANAGVISKLTIRQWSGRKSDKQAGRETAARNRADEKMVRVSKTLIPVEALEPIKQLGHEVRTYHYESTVVWAEGAQFLPSRLSIPYSAAMQEYQLRFDRLAREFCTAYPGLVEAAPQLLGALYCEEDYPTPERNSSGGPPLPSREESRLRTFTPRLHPTQEEAPGCAPPARPGGSAD